MTDAPKTSPPAQPVSGTPPPRAPQFPPPKATGSIPSSVLPNPTLPKPSIPRQGATLPGYGGGTGNLNKAQLPPLNPPPSSVKLSSTNQAQTALGRPSSFGKPPPPVSAAAMPPKVVSKPVAVTPVSTARPAVIGNSPFRLLPFILGGLVVVGVIIFILSKILGGGAPATPSINGSGASPKTQVTLTYWGLWEPSAVLSEIISDYQESHPNIRIQYSQQSHRDYSDRLQAAIAKKQGPDIFRYHASWVPMLRQELSAMPASVYSDTEYQNTFYPVAVKQLKYNSRFVGIPLQYEGLALYYNQDVLSTANVQPPTTWADMKRVATQLTIKDPESGKIRRSGLAIGNTSNVDHFSDVLGLLLLQNGVDPTNVTTQPAKDAISFYTSFINQDKVWDSTLPNSTTAFARGDVAMIFAPSWRAHDIQAMNPNLKFGIAPVPQLTANKVTWASYWAEGVNAQSTHQAEAWEFLKYMSSAETMQKFYSTAKKVRAFGEIYSRKDLAGSLASDPFVSAFLSDAPFAKNWYLNSLTHDNGINDNIIKYFEDAVNQSLGSGASNLPTSMSTAQQGQTQILNQYGINLAPVAPVSTP